MSGTPWNKSLSIFLCVSHLFSSIAVSLVLPVASSVSISIRIPTLLFLVYSYFVAVSNTTKTVCPVHHFCIRTPRRCGIGSKCRHPCTLADFVLSAFSYKTTPMGPDYRALVSTLLMVCFRIPPPCYVGPSQRAVATRTMLLVGCAPPELCFRC